MQDLQSSIAEVKSTVEAALKRQSDQGILTNLLDALQAIESKTTSSKNGVKKQLNTFDKSIQGLSANICALKEGLMTQGGKPDKATTNPEDRQETRSVSALMAEVSAQGVKLDKAITIIETQQDMMKTLLDLLQKGSVEPGSVRLHSHVNGVAERIALVDGQTSQNAPSTTAEHIVNDLSQSLDDLALPDPSMDVDVSEPEPHPMADALASATSSLPIETPAILHSDPSNKPEADETAVVIVDAPPADAPPADAPSAGAPSADAPSAGAPSAGAPSAGTPSAGTPSADIIGITIATVAECPSAHIDNIMETAPHQSPNTISDTTTVIANASHSTLDTPDPVIVAIASETEGSNVKENVDHDIVPHVVGK